MLRLTLFQSRFRQRGRTADTVKAGQVLARLDTTLASADKAGVASDLASQQMQERRIVAELADQPMMSKAGDDPLRFAKVQSQYIAHRRAYLDGLDQERSLLTKASHERRSAMEILAKLEQTLPTYRRSAESYAKLEKEGFIGGLAAAEKQREAIEKARDLDAQQAMVAALNATIEAQQKKISQLQSTYRSELQRELADIRARIQQAQPNLDKTVYREGLMELRAPQDGAVKDLATTTVGAVVQPGAMLFTLVPKGEQLFADVSIKNEDVGFVQVGQSAQIKLAAYPFQQYGMLTGKVTRVSADATESSRPNGPPPGMQVMAEINQGKRTVLEYLLSPVQKAVNEAGRER